MGTTILRMKVSKRFLTRLRVFCAAHRLHAGKFAARALAEAVEDHHFGRKAQRVLGRSTGRAIRHEDAFGTRR